ncbi:hypothetical protein B4901_09555 [Yersinia frederiksenii]|nr:hypothetical protein B4901_09555 [Yersinia frederiksenii]
MRKSPCYVVFLYPSSFKLQVCWLFSVTRITHLCKFIRNLSFVALLHDEIYWVFVFLLKKNRNCGKQATIPFSGGLAQGMRVCFKR